MYRDVHLTVKLLQHKLDYGRRILLIENNGNYTCCCTQHVELQSYILSQLLNICILLMQGLGTFSITDTSSLKNFFFFIIPCDKAFKVLYKADVSGMLTGRQVRCFLGKGRVLQRRFLQCGTSDGTGKKMSKCLISLKNTHAMGHYCALPVFIFFGGLE